MAQLKLPQAAAKERKSVARRARRATLFLSPRGGVGNTCDGFL